MSSGDIQLEVAVWLRSNESKIVVNGRKKIDIFHVCKPHDRFTTFEPSSKKRFYR